MKKEYGTLANVQVNDMSVSDDTVMHLATARGLLFYPPTAGIFKLKPKHPLNALLTAPLSIYLPPPPISSPSSSSSSSSSSSLSPLQQSKVEFVAALAKKTPGEPFVVPRLEDGYPLQNQTALAVSLALSYVASFEDMAGN